MAYLEFVKSAGSTYVYVTEYVGKQEKTLSVKKRIMSLGRQKKAIEKLKKWKSGEKKEPFYIGEDRDYLIDKWIKKVEERGAY